MKWKSAIALMVCLCCTGYFAFGDEKSYPEEKVVAFDAHSFDFGDILLSAGPVECSFTFRNVASFPIQIFNIVSSCGCTKPTWTKGFIQPGDAGKIDVVFNNNQGPYPFDKTLTVYVSNVSRPVILHVRGTVCEKMKPLDERFPFHFGKVGLRNMECSVRTLVQGSSKSDYVRIANFGRRDASVKVIPLTAGLSASVVPNPVPASGLAELRLCVDTRKTDGLKWGNEQFLCLMEVDGRRYPDTFRVNAMILDDFSSWDNSATERGACAKADCSYFEFGEVAAGKAVTATFTIRNTGRSELVVHKIDCDDPRVRVAGTRPFSLKPGAAATIKAPVDTKRGDGEMLATLSVISNSPSKPVLSLIISGSIKPKR